MTTESPQTDKTKLSLTNVDSPGQMRGWFKLIETIRKTDPPSTELFQSPSNSQTNGHRSKSPETIHIDSSQSKSPNLISSPPLISLPPSPIQSFDETPLLNIESKATTEPETSMNFLNLDPKRRSTRHKKITIRKSTRSKEPPTINTAPDDDIILIDTQQRKRQSIDSSLPIPLATDPQSLPGHDQDDLRDQRFLDYSDFNTLSIHLKKCLYIDKKSFSSANLTKQHIFKTRHNILTKIFKLYYIKTFPKSSKLDQNLFLNKSIDSATSNLSSYTSTSFKTDWSVNRRSSSSHHYEPKNVFHILQLNPKKELFPSTNHQSPKTLSIADQYQINHEHIKNLLVRTYYPHFHTAFEYGYYFGAKPKIPIKHQNLPIVKNLELTSDIDESMTITLKSPPSIFQYQSKKRGRKAKHQKIKDQPKPITFSERRVSEEIPPVSIGTPTKVSPPPSPLMNNKRKRKVPITINSNTNERKKKKVISLPSPEIIHEYQEISYSDSDEDVLPDELPKQNFIKNGLRSNYYKSTTDVDPKSISNKNRFVRRRRQSSGSLPPFYTGIFESDDERFSYINYQLPFDIYWFSQKHQTTSSKSPHQTKRKKLAESKPQSELSYKSFSRNTPTDAPVHQNLFSSNKLSKPLKMEDLTPREKQIISQTSIFLKRNLRRIKERRDLKDKNANQHKQQIDEQPSLLVFPQNYYHSNITNETNSSNLSHKDLLNLFINHIRRSHFAKTGQCAIELIDKTCYYAQLAQLTIILNEIFDLLLNYKCQSSEIYSSNALKKCPLKRLFPMYYEIILKPIDLTIIRNKLDHGDYLSYDLFEKDLLLLFNNAITYCGEDSDVGRAVKELQRYFIDGFKIEYQSTINLFNHLNEENKNQRNLQIFTDFIRRLHEKEVLNGQIREILADIIFNIDTNQTVSVNTPNSHRIIKNHWIVHCRCGSNYDETSLVQCYACQLWQHVSCVTIVDSFRPYYCFECHPLCEENPLSCLKTNVHISFDNQSSYTTITRSDGFIVRINECYFIKKQEENVKPMEYDIFSIERLWIDENNTGRASGFYYIRPSETFHEANRKFFSNEIFRFPSTNDSIEIDSIIRPCYILDTGTFCKGKPIVEYTSRLLSTDLFICEYRVDKLARTFTRLPKSKHLGINTKSYCFDNYIEKLSIKRDYQSHQKESHETSRRRSITHPIKFSTKQLEEKSSHVDGIIERIYCHFHHSNLIPTDTKFSPNQYYQQPIIDRNNNRGSKRLRAKNSSSSLITNKKRRTRSISSNDNPTECIADKNPNIVSSLLAELIESISSHIV